MGGAHFGKRMPMTASFASPAERDRLARLFGAISSDAGVAVMEVYRSDFETRTKADRSPVSDADEKAEEIILARLHRELPGVPVLAEERAAREGVGGSIADAFLLVDPVDGTKEFIQRKGDFTVNIALIVGGRPVAGCVYAPARQEMYVGGAEARLVEGFAAGSKLTDGRVLTTRAYPGDGLVAITSSSHLDDETKKFLARHRIKASDRHRLVAEILLGGCRQGGRLSALGPDDGVGHGGGPCGSAGRRRVRGPPGRIGFPLWQGRGGLPQRAVHRVGAGAGSVGAGWRFAASCAADAQTSELGP